MTPHYDAVFVILSVIVAMLASFAALDLAGRVRSKSGAARLGWIAGGAVVMGVAISGMHYTAMAAARFAPSHAVSRSVNFILASDELGGAVVVSAILIIALALIGAVIDRKAQARWAVTRELTAQTVQLGKSELQYRLLFDHNPNPMWVYAATTQEFLAVNAAAVAGYGYTRQEFLSMTMDQIRVDSADLCHKRKDGTLIEVAVTSQELVFDGGEACLTLALDVTDRKRAEEALRQSEQRTRLIINTALDAVITMDSAGRITEWNSQAERLFGWSREEILGKHMADTIIPAAYRERHARGLKKFLESGEGPVLNRRIEITALQRDGVEIPVELAISPAKLGTEWTFSAFIRDLSEQKNAAEALRRGEKRYHQLFEDMPIGLYRSTPDGFLIDANPAMISMLGYSDRASLLATPASMLYVDPADRARWSDEMSRTGVVRDFEVKLRRADGAVIWARDTTLAQFDSAGRVTLYEGVIEDITDRRSLEAQLNHASKMEAVGRLAGGVAHDFNNVLTVIMSYAAMLTDSIGSNDPNREDVQAITSAAERARGLTRQLLAFSRKQVLQPRVININAVISDLESMLRRLIGEDIELLTSLDPLIGRINADPGQLEQVLMNLVVNARDAMPDGGRLSIRTSNSALSTELAMGALHAGDGDYVMLAVSDTGLGMTREVQQRLFDPFFTTKEQGRGTGLGLSTVYGIIKQSGGEIYVYSEIGAGTTFKVYFPRLAATAEERHDEVEHLQVPRGSETVLLVEDDAILRTLAVRLLTNYGYRVVAADGGSNALAIVSAGKTRIDGVISDVVMPGMNGRELVEKILELRPRMPCLLMSGYADDDILRRGISEGERMFLHKPFTPEQLAQQVRALLDSKLPRAVA